MMKDAVFALKTNPVIRAIVYPYYTYSRASRTRGYCASEDSENIKIWKDLYTQNRCWIIGNGPSLAVSDVEHLSEEITFASNRIYHLYDKTAWRPDFYVAFEPEFTRTNSKMLSQIEVKKARFINSCGKQNAVYEKNNYWLNCTCRFTLRKLTPKNIEFSEDISKQVNDAYSVTFTILQLAIYMGFKEIYLLGVDHYQNVNSNNSTHFYLDRKNEYRTPTYLEGIEYGYLLAKQEAEKRGIHIVNATRGGNLEVFDRVEFDSLWE